MTYVFVFVGEFGYELLNWQGVVRRFRRLNPEAEVVCAGRASVEPLYENAEYVDIGEVPEYRDSIATGYFAHLPGDDVANSAANRELDGRLRAAAKSAITAELRDRMGIRWWSRRLSGIRFIFSSGKTEIDGCVFGADQRLFGDYIYESDIYSQLDLGNNLYRKLDPVLAHRDRLEQQLGHSLEQPFALVQTRKRSGQGGRSERTLDEASIVEALQRDLPVVLVDFTTGRAGDSYSELPSLDRVKRVRVSGFGEQSCLIHYAAACVFLSEGDYGSHIYLPPLFGRDVWSIAPGDVYELGTAPVEFWNRHVFRFGGQIRPVVGEEIESSADLTELAAEVARNARPPAPQAEIDPRRAQALER